MSKRSVLPQSRRHILVYDEDWEFLDTAFGKDTDKPVGVGVAIRQLIHASVSRMRADIQRRLDDKEVDETLEYMVINQQHEDTNL